MTPETKKTLLALVSEYGDSLNRVAAEKDLMKVMAQRANIECAVPEAAFKRVALAYWKDAAQEECEALNELLAVFESVVRNQDGHD